MKSITDDILEWSEKYIEPKNEHLGVSVCPYAKRARLENKYKILECHNFAHFQDIRSHFSTIQDRLDTCILQVQGRGRRSTGIAREIASRLGLAD